MNRYWFGTNDGSNFSTKPKSVFDLPPKRDKSNILPTCQTKNTTTTKPTIEKQTDKNETHLHTHNKLIRKAFASDVISDKPTKGQRPHTSL